MPTFNTSQEDKQYIYIATHEQILAQVLFPDFFFLLTFLFGKKGKKASKRLQIQGEILRSENPVFMPIFISFG